MCISATTMLAISTGFQVVSMLSQGQQQADQANWQADQADWQARQAAADAQAEREAGEIRADKVRKAGRAQQSEARASLAASGVETGAGTPLKIAQEIARNAEADAQQELLSGKYRGQRLDQESEISKISSSNYKTAASNFRTNSLLSAGAEIGTGWARIKEKS